MKHNSPLRTVLVDGSPECLVRLEKWLGTLSNFSVVGKASSGVDALEQCRMLRPDLVLMDVALPCMNGYEATARIKEGGHCPMIILMFLFHMDEAYAVDSYSRHNGPNSDNPSSNHAPTVVDGSIDTAFGSNASLTLVASDIDGNALTLRIVSQPVHGTVALVNRVATYVPELGFSGDEEFTFAASDTKSDSNLGRMQVHVQAGTALFRNGFEN